MTLPKFLLAWSDFNWLGFCKWLRPAKDENWSIFRVLGLTALSFVVGAGFGLVLSLALMRQPVGWLPWLLGLAGGCAGLCWFGVTALCWNQRAVQLRANPALPTDLPKARYQFFRWCLGFVYFAILGVLTPFALMVTVENVRGEITWNRERARLEAAGEKLTFREILGPEIPPEQNAGAEPVFAPFFDYGHRMISKVRVRVGGDFYASAVVWAQSNRLSQLEKLFEIPTAYLPRDSGGSRQNPQTPLIQIADWSTAYRNALDAPRQDDQPWVAGLKLPTPGDPASDVLVALSRADRELDEICAAAARPRSQFPVHYDESFDALLRHLSVMKGIERTLQLRCAAHLALGETDAAFADATNALNVAELLREEPLLISQLVRHAQLNIAISTLWQGLAQHRWSDPQLEFFQQRLAQVDLMPGIVLAFEGERAGGIAGMEKFITEPGSRVLFLGEKSGTAGLMAMIGRGVMRQNQVALAEFHSRNLETLRKGLKAVPEEGWVATIDEQQEAVFARELARVYSPYRAIATMLAPALSKATQKTARTEVLVKLAIVACALERYRLAHGEFPENLEQLAPQFASEVPPDPMVNEPFRYQRTDDGWFELYSVGLNGRDDAGVMASGDRNDREEKDWPWPVPTRPMHPRLF